MPMLTNIWGQACLALCFEDRCFDLYAINFIEKVEIASRVVVSEPVGEVVSESCPSQSYDSYPNTNFSLEMPCQLAAAYASEMTFLITDITRLVDSRAKSANHVTLWQGHRAVTFVTYFRHA